MITEAEKSNLIVGYKQVLRALKANSCQKLFLTEDCSGNIFDTIKSEAGQTEIVMVPTMLDLGSMCGIDVAASCAAVIRL